jgi:hypothetical protein
MIAPLLMSKRRAFFSHLAISAIVVGVVVALIIFSWYPAPYFDLSGAGKIVRILVGVDLVLGPALTLLLYRPGKPGLMFDVSFIATVQVAALVYGISAIYSERPYFVVFAVDRFEIVAKTEIAPPGDDENIELPPKPWGEPIMAIATLPKDEKARQKLLDEVLSGMPDISRRPEFWSDFASGIEVILSRAKPLKQLSEQRDDVAVAVARIIKRRPNAEALVYLPIMWKTEAYTLVIDPVTARPVDYLLVDPWSMGSSTDAGGG